MSRYATVVLLICIVASARAQSDDTRGNDVIQHYVRWRGGSAFQALRSIHLTAIGRVMKIGAPYIADYPMGLVVQHDDGRISDIAQGQRP